MKTPLVVFVVLLGALALGPSRLATAQHAHPAPAPSALSLGTVDFPNTGADAAQEPFLRGLALLHSYHYDEARAAFQQARTADPAFALAYWLEALTHSQFDWAVEDLPAAHAVLARFAPTPEQRLARAGSDAERALGAAIEAFLADGTPPDRAKHFAQHTRAWADADPSSIEAAAFAARSALYLIFSAPPAERIQRTEEAIALAERVVALNPQHPGGLHYLLHATDSPRYAARGLEAARRYDQVAPALEHALHMPSHIFLQLGLWDGVVASNERAWPASRTSHVQGGHALADLGWHSLEWLLYGYLQQGRYAAAEALLDTARTLLAGVDVDTLAGYPDVRFALESLAFHYGVETGRWHHYPVRDTAAVAARLLAEPSPRARMMAVHAAYHAGMAALLDARDTLRAAVFLHGLQEAAAAVPENDRLRSLLERAAAQLGAYHAWTTGRREAALASLTAVAASLQDAGLTPVGPPRTLPVHEALGAFLLEDGRPQEAVAAYEAALADRPNRSAAWLGLARARRAASDRAGAAAAYARLLANWQQADDGLPALAEARAAAEQPQQP